MMFPLGYEQRFVGDTAPGPGDVFQSPPPQPKVVQIKLHTTYALATPTSTTSTQAATTSTTMSTGEKIAIGVVVLGVAGLVAWVALK